MARELPRFYLPCWVCEKNLSSRNIHYFSIPTSDGTLTGQPNEFSTVRSCSDCAPKLKKVQEGLRDWMLGILED